jgi:UDP-N-acetylmuramoylalanine--D-glutamate ligase
MQFLKDTAVLILGLGESGLACVQFAKRFGARVTVADSRLNPPGLNQIAAFNHIKTVLGNCSPDLLNNIDTVVISPGISPHSIDGLLSVAQQKSIKVISELDWFNQALLELKQQYNYQPYVLGITGTNGKTTVTELTTHVCNEAGLKAVACGNISPAALTALMRALDAYTEHNTPLPDVWVLELSSFQLHYTQCLTLTAAALLNISQDHLDWHGDINAYARDKANIFKHCQLNIVNRDDAVCMSLLDIEHSTVPTKTFGLNQPSRVGDVGCHLDGVMWLTLASVASHTSKQTQSLTLQTLIPTEALLLRGTHNHANALAAILLTQATGITLTQTINGLRSYKGAPNRCELVRVINDVEYINDSKGTNIGATVAALMGLSEQRKRLVLIAGGVGKGQDFSDLAHHVITHCKAVILIGEAASDIAHSIQLQLNTDNQHKPLFIAKANDLDNAVKQASQLAHTGDAVLLSPACASFDMFDNYVHRAQCFITAVHELAADNGHS